MSQNKIESILNETRRFEPPERFVSNSQLTIQSLARLKQKALDDYEKFWADLAHQEIQWFTPLSGPALLLLKIRQKPLSELHQS